MKLLIVIDMQNDFIDGSLGTKEAVAIVPNVAKKIAKARAAGETVIFTRDTHQKCYLETQEGKNLPVLYLQALLMYSVAVLQFRLHQNP